MKQKTYYKTVWGKEHPPFTCKIAGKLHYPEVEVWVEADAASKELPYTVSDSLMYELQSSTFEGLAKHIARGLTEKQDKWLKVTVRVKEGPDFFVEVVEEK